MMTKLQHNDSKHKLTKTTETFSTGVHKTYSHSKPVQRI